MISPDVRHSFLLSSKTVFMDLAAFRILRVGLWRGKPWTQSIEHPQARRKSPQGTVHVRRHFTAPSQAL